MKDSLKRYTIFYLLDLPENLLIFCKNIYINIKINKKMKDVNVEINWNKYKIKYEKVVYLFNCCLQYTNIIRTNSYAVAK